MKEWVVVGAGKANWVELANEAYNSRRVWTKGRLGGQPGVCGITTSSMVVARALAVTTGLWRALRRRPHLSANLQMAGRGSSSETLDPYRDCPEAESAGMTGPCGRGSFDRVV
jgi:hypothetical protein